MFKNYLKTAYRNLLRFKLDSFLNISGLVIGLAAALLIMLYIQHERSHDQFWQDSDRLHRIQTRWVMQGREDIDVVNSTGPLKAALEAHFPNELEAVARLHEQEQLIDTGSESFSDTVGFVDPEILDIFDFDIVSGDPNLALAGNSSIIINESLARKYFGSSDPIGKTLTLSLGYLERDYHVLAVMRDLPPNSHLDTQAMIKIDENDFVDNDGTWMFSSWNAANNHTYFKLRPGVDISEIDRQIPEFTDKAVPDDEGRASAYTKLSTIPVPAIHLYSEGAGDFKAGGDSETVFAFEVIALLIVLVAAINYVNLSTARAGQRAKETAMRKVMGASRGQLLTQHLGESLLIVTFSVGLAIVCVEMVLPFFSHMLGIRLTLGFVDPVFLAQVTCAIVAIGILSGIYPALILASFPPSSTLQANRSTRAGNTISARNVLVTFQIAVTVALVIATSVVFAQLSYFHWLDRGFEPDDLLVIEKLSHNDIGEKRVAFRNEVQMLPGVQAVSLSFEAPTNYFENNTSLKIPGESEEQTYQMGVTFVDHEYINTLRIPLLAGRFFQQDRALDQLPSTADMEDGDLLQGNLVINEQALKTFNLGTPEEALGRTVENVFETRDGGLGKVGFTVIGVIGNTNLHSAKTSVRPEIYQVMPRLYQHMLVRISGNTANVVEQIRTIWLDMMPENPFEYFYVDQALESEFRSETNQASVFLGFAILTMVIGCLGLYGLAAFVTESRRKEIGIRKILGANISNILSLLLGQFSKLVIAANLIAWPVIYLLMSEWLQQYPFRISADWILAICVLAGLLAAVIVAITVGSQAWGVARANPIEAIRHE